MKTLRTVYHLTRADFLERVRGYGFLVTIGLGVLMGYNVIIGRFGLTFGGYEGAANTAWIGAVSTVTMTPYVMLLGFYLVRGAINRDRFTGVGQIIATTPISKVLYTVGKFASNLLVLAAMVGVLMLAGAVMSLVRGQGQTFDLWALIAPFVFLTLPIAALTAGLAVLFDSIPILSRGFGNILYLFGFYTLMIGSLAFFPAAKRVMGLNLVDEQIVPALAALDPSYSGGWALGITPPGERTFLWEGFTWTGEVVLNRAVWAGAAVVFAFIAALPFDRFDPAQQGVKREKRGLRRRVWTWCSAILRGNFLRRKAPDSSIAPEETAISLTPLDTTSSRGAFWGLVLAELKLMFKGHLLIWYFATIGLNIACVVSPPDMVRQSLFPLVWLWPVLIWSQMGTREAQHNTGQMVFSAPRPVIHQLLAMWLAAVCFTSITTSGTAIHLALSGEIVSLFAWGVGVSFVPALALTLGMWSETNRLFEVIYSLMWYFSLIDRVPAFDYAGANAEGLAMGMPVVYFVITIGLMVLAVFGRWRQIQV
jgi:hypothetical protein